MHVIQRYIKQKVKSSVGLCDLEGKPCDSLAYALQTFLEIVSKIGDSSLGLVQLVPLPAELCPQPARFIFVTFVGLL